MNFKEDEIFLINVLGKRMPFAKKFKYEMKSDDLAKIYEGLAKMPTKVAVIDDAGYLMTNAFMKGHRGGDQFKLYNDIGDMMWGLVNVIKNSLPEDVIVYLMFHDDTDDNGNVRIRTIGKLLDQKVCLEGMVTICLRCLIKNGQHVFITQSDGYDLAKSPEGMFEAEIDNDLKLVDDTIRSYYGFANIIAPVKEPTKEEPKENKK